MTLFSRRQANHFLAAVSLSTAISRSAEAASQTSREALLTPGDATDLTTGKGNMLTMARIHSNMDASKIKHGWYTGRVMAVQEGQAVRDLLGIRGMSSSRYFPDASEDGIVIMRAEVGFFFDLATGDVIDSWRNPYTEENVEVVHVGNTHLKMTYNEYFKSEAFYGDSQDENAAPKPYILDWQRSGDRLFVEQHQHFWVQNPLDPNKWVRESSGPMIQISDMMTFNISAADQQNSEVTSLNYTGDWVHVRPWQPWMLMGELPGHLLNRAFTGSADSLDEIPSNIRQDVETRAPEFFDAPTEIKRSEPSLVRYMNSRTPAPLKEGVMSDE